MLRRTPHVRGRVVAEDGAALEFFEVNGQRYTTPDGSFDRRLFGAQGPQRLVVRARGYATVDRSVTPDGGGDVDLGTVTPLLLPGQTPAPDSPGALEHLRLQQHPVEEWTRASVTFRRVPAGHYTVIASTRDQDRIHREELDVPEEGALSRDVKPVWRPLAR
ncbi:hypothetical protein [Corallococcus sp. RDP092CA]|uniref:hypothetical protein n=1 Tax=Corallococcus sp. RDP092CA TaxID=3109369 RepID=UPI0035B0E54C